MSIPKKLSKVEMLGLESAVMRRDEAAKRYNDACAVFEDVCASLGLDPTANVRVMEDGTIIVTSPPLTEESDGDNIPPDKPEIRSRVRSVGRKPAPN